MKKILPAIVLVATALSLLGCGGGSSLEAQRPRGIFITLLEYQAVAQFADAVTIRLMNRSGQTLVSLVSQPIQRDYKIMALPVEGDHIDFDYLKAGVLVGDSTVAVNLTDSSETIIIAGNPVGDIDLISNDQGFTLTHAKMPMVIKGVGFDYTRLDQKSPGQWFTYVNPTIARLGANTIRTYGIPWADGGSSTPGSPAYQAQDTHDLLAYAAQNDLKVLVGILVDGSATESRVADFVNRVQADPNFKNVFGWCVGNEVVPAYQHLIEPLLKVVKASMKSPSQVRPVASAFPAVSAGYVATIQQNYPSLDILGINNFHGCFDDGHCGGGYLATQASSLATGGWKKPWMITEYASYDIQAASMPFQVLNGGDKYMLEVNSTQNAKNYRTSYLDYIVSDYARQTGSIGGFVLNFGPPHNSKLVAYWLEPMAYTGAFTPFVNPPWNNGADQFVRFASLDAVASMYGGSLGAPCPEIVVDSADNDPQGISCDFKATLAGPGKPLTPGQTGVTASVMAKSGNLTFTWYLIGGSSAGFSGNIEAAGTNPQAYEQPTTHYLGTGMSNAMAGGITKNTIVFPVPNARGNNYQLRVIVSDSTTNGAATAAVGFAVN